MRQIHGAGFSRSIYHGPVKCDIIVVGSILFQYLFDKLLDSLRGKMRLDTLKLITNIVHKQPSWLHCITSHKILSQILGIIKVRKSYDQYNNLCGLPTTVVII